MSSPAQNQPHTQRFNVPGGLSCPVCFRPASLALVGGFYHCRDGCATWFRFYPETADRLATLERARPVDLDSDRHADAHPLGEWNGAGRYARPGE